MESAAGHPPDNERRLVERLRDGDTEAFAALFEEHRRGLLAYVAALVSDRPLAEDIVQDCFVEMARRARGLRPERGVAGWLYRVGRNRAIDALRRRRFEAPPLAEPEDGRAAAAEIAETGGPTPAEELMAREQAEQVRACLQRIPRGERDLLLLRFYGGLTFREAAAVLRRPLGTALWQGQRSLKRLRAMLERGGRQG